MDWIYNDGGRETTGYVKGVGDCVTRAIAIATGKPYLEVYNGLNDLRDSKRQTKRIRNSSARNGVSSAVYEPYLKALGWKWTATMRPGSGCRVHLKADELPSGRIIVRLSKHLAAVINGVVHDTYDSTRNETRCVYGYWTEVKL